MLRKINKQTEPPCLTQLRSSVVLTDPNNFELLTAGCKTEIRRQLRTEQFGLCAFCNRRMNPFYGGKSFLTNPLSGEIEASGTSFENGWPDNIEHIKPQRAEDGPSAEKRYPELSLVYSNLVGCCASKYSGETICNGAKGNKQFQFADPVSGAGLPGVSISSIGALVTEDARVAADIELLNLNCKALNAARKSVEIGLRDQLSKAPSSSSRKELQKAWRRFTVPVGGVLPEFAEVARRYLEPMAKRENLF